MKVFVINLDRRPDRMDAVSKQLRAVNVKFERVPAIDARDVDVWSQARKLETLIYDGFRSPQLGMIACYLTHRRIWQRIVEEKISHAMILEDDVVVTDFDYAIMLIDLAAVGLDILRLEEISASARSRISMQRFSLPLLGRQAVGGLTYGTAAYVVTTDGARKLLAVGKYWFNLDHFDIWEGVYGVRSAVLRPNMFVQRDLGSNITTDDRYPGDIRAIFADFLSPNRPSFGVGARRLKRWLLNAFLDLLAYVPRKLLLAYHVYRQQ